MRPPPGRVRRGVARRDSNLAMLGAIFTGVVLALALLLLLLQRVDPDLGGRLRGAMLDALQPLLSLARAPLEAARAVGNAVDDHWRVVAENRALRAELAHARAAAARTEAMAVELRRLQALVALRRPERRLVISTVASASPTTATSRTAIIGAGYRQGVRPRMPVIAAEGIAGRVIDVGRDAARVQLLTDAGSRVPVKVLRTGWTGLAVGTGGTLLDFVFDIASGVDRIRVGDRLVTSGDGGLFPPGLPVAVIVDAGATPPRARPLANPTGLGVVSVEAPWLPPPAVVPASPATPEPDRPPLSAAPSATATAANATSATAATVPRTAAAAPRPSGPGGAAP